MLVNGIDIVEFGAYQSSVDPRLSTINNYSNWNNSGLRPVFLRFGITFKEIEALLYFMGENEADNLENISNFVNAIKDASVYEFENLEHKFECIVTSAEQERQSRRFYTLKLTLQGFEYGDECIDTLDGVTYGSITMQGNLETPCIVTIIPLISQGSFEISGLSKDVITVRNLINGVPIIIDGEKCTVTQQGNNKFLDCILWQFPSLKPGINNITFNTGNNNIAIKYKPMYL